MNTSIRLFEAKLISVILVLLSVLMQGVAYSQSTLYTQNFGTTGATPTGWTLSNWTINNTVTSTGYIGASGSYNAFIGSITGSAYLTFNNSTTPLSTIGYSNITVLWGGRRYTDDAVTLYFQWSSDGNNWNTVTGWTDVTADANWYLVNGGARIILPSDAEGVANLRFRWYETNPNQGYRLDDFTVQGTLPPTSPYTISTPGTSSFKVPSGVNQLTVECWGGGGRGGARTSSNNVALAGGGGGAYSKSDLSVTPDATYNLWVGAGSTSAASPGGDSWFGSTTTLLAKGGQSVANNSNTSGAGGLWSDCIGETRLNGGNGAIGTGGSFGGGGGSSAGTASAGDFTDAETNQQSGATAPSGGGDGGTGAASNTAGVDGAAPGGGGGGGYRAGTGTTENPGDGANGQVRISWSSCPAISASETHTNITCFNINDGTITITASGGTGPWSYSVDNGENYTSSGTNPYTFSGLSANVTYKIRVKDSAGCESPAIP